MTHQIPWIHRCGRRDRSMTVKKKKSIDKTSKQGRLMNMCVRKRGHQRQIYNVKRRGCQASFSGGKCLGLAAEWFQSLFHTGGVGRRRRRRGRKSPPDVTDVTWKAGCVWHFSLWTHSAAVWSALSWSLHPRSRSCQNGAERLWRSHARDLLRLSPLAGFQPIATKKKKKKLATWSTRLASNGPGLYFSNLITLLLKNFCQDCNDARKAKRRLLCFDGAKKGSVFYNLDRSGHQNLKQSHWFVVCSVHSSTEHFLFLLIVIMKKIKVQNTDKNKGRKNLIK